MQQRETQTTAAAAARGPARFIVGMPRAATTWLVKCFNEHPETAAFGESMFFGRRFVQPQRDGRYSSAQVDAIARRLTDGTCLQSVKSGGPGALRNVTQDTLGDVVDAARRLAPEHPTPGELFNAFARCIAEAEGKGNAIEKTPHHLNWLDRIFAAFPDARVAVMLREPYSFMLSYKHQGDRKREAHRKLLARLYHPLACAMIWRASMRSALAVRRVRSDQVLFVDHEEIVANGAKILSQVQRFFHLEPADLASKVPPDNTSFPSGARPNLQPEDLFWLNLVAGRTMDRAGYVRQHAGVTPLHLLRIAWSVLRLPIWGIGCLWILRQNVDGSLVRYMTRWFRPARTHQDAIDRRASSAASAK